MNEADEVLSQLLLNFKRNSNLNLCDSTDLLDSVQLISFWTKLGISISGFCDNATGTVTCSSLARDESISMLKSVATFMLMYLESNHRVTEHFLACVEMLHDLLIPLDDDLNGAKSLKVSISRICECYYLKGLLGGDGVVSQLVVYLLIIANSDTCKDADIKRLYAIRSAIQLFDFGDDSIETIRDLILQLFSKFSVLKVMPIAPTSCLYLNFVLNIGCRR